MCKILLIDKDETRYSTLEQAYEHCTDFRYLSPLTPSDERRDYIKILFNKLLNNLVNTETKCLIASLQKTKPSELLRKVKAKNKREKYSEATLPVTHNNFNVADIFYKGPFSSGFIQFMETDGLKAIGVYKKIMRW